MTDTLDDLTRRAALRLMELLKRDQDIRFAPLTMLLTGFGTAAAVIGATVALVKLLSL